MYLCFANTESRRRAEDNAFFRAVFRAGAIVSNRCVADAQQTEKMAFEIVETLFRGICVGVAASITVGPVAVLCIQRTLSKSRRSGIVSGIGVACADTFMAMAALFFYSMLQTQIEQYNTLLRVIGGIFVVIVGVFIFAQNPVPQIRRNRAGKTSLWQDFASIFGLTIGVVDPAGLRHQPLPPPLPSAAHAHDQPRRGSHHRHIRHLHHIIDLL